MAGPFTQPVAAALFLGLLAVVLAGWVAVVSTLARTAFVAGMVPVIFLLLSLNTESLGIFNTSERYFLYLMLGLIGRRRLWAARLCRKPGAAPARP